MNFLRSLFAKRRYEQVIRKGVMYRQTYKGTWLVREVPIDANGGFTRLTDQRTSDAVGDRKRTDLYRSHPVTEKVNFTKKPDVL